MAIDTRQKRFSMMGFGDGVITHTLFEPDGTVDLDDRQRLLGCYSGIAFGSPVAVTGTAKHAQGTLVGLKHMMGM